MPVVPGRSTERVGVTREPTCCLWHITLRYRTTTQVGNSPVHHKAGVIRIRSPTDAVKRRYSEVRVKDAVVIKVQIIALKHVARIGRVHQDERLGAESHCDAVCEHEGRRAGVNPTRTIETLGIDNRDRPVRTKSHVANVGDVTHNSKLTRVAIDRQEERIRRQLSARSAEYLDILTPFRGGAWRIHLDLIQNEIHRRRRWRWRWRGSGRWRGRGRVRGLGGGRVSGGGRMGWG